MNQTTAVDNDLQKAIDDITKSTNSDPVFGDPVAAPAPVEMPPIDTTPIAPAPKPEPVAPEFTALAAPALDDTAMPPVEPILEPAAPAEPVTPVEFIAPVVEEETIVATADAPNDLDMHQLKEAALRDLAPLLSKMDVDPEQKFELYKSMIEDLHDSSVVSSAYALVKDLPEDKRGEALFYIIETIDKA